MTRGQAGLAIVAVLLGWLVLGHAILGAVQ